MGALPHGPLHADFYAFTMGEALFREGKIDTPSTFQSFIRKPPFGGSYLLVAGLNDWLDWLREWQFKPEYIAWLATQTHPSGKPIFSKGYLDWLEHTPLQLNVTVLPEGQLAFANTPLAIISGPMGQCLIAEAMLLNIVNSQSLIATAASRCRYAAGDDVLVEGGLRRAQDIGGFGPTRAAYIGGFNATSNTAAAYQLGIPAKGTFAHAYVVFHISELEAMLSYATHMPEGLTFLVDTYGTLNGVRLVIDVCKQLGVKPAGIRLDSGDLAWLSKEAKQMLREAGFNDTIIIASNDLDAHSIAALKQQQAKGEAHIDAWLVGTKVVTASEQPALGGVYKLVQVGDRKVIKVAERGTVGVDSKTTIPGSHLAIRYLRQTALGQQWYGDTLLAAEDVEQLLNQTTEDKGVRSLPRDVISVNLADPERPKRYRAGTSFVMPYKVVMKDGVEVAERVALRDIQRNAAANLALLAPEHKRLTKPHLYVAGVEESLYEERRQMVREIYLATQTA
jgi:nicotinate phosphoribosyltransferase